MPRFAANIAYMFTERPLLERVGAAAKAGFPAIELQFPYEHASAAAMKAEIERHGVKVLGLNTPPGREGEFGLAAAAGREREFHDQFRMALDYILAIGGRAVHCLAGKVPVEQRPAAERIYVSNLAWAADLAQEKNIFLLIEPINTRERPDYFLSRVEHAADVIAKVGRAECQNSVRLLSCADHAGRSPAAVREISAGRSATCRLRRCRRATSRTKVR